MKTSRSLRQFLTEARKGDSYWVEKVKLQFALILDERRKATGMTCKAMADKIGASAPYITKVLRGDENLTIESMVKLAHSTGGRLQLSIADAALADVHWDATSLVSKVRPLHSGSVATTASVAFDLSAANHELFEHKLVAA
jgi:transcriptional regulator with XRE-family HTH domain